MPVTITQTGLEQSQAQIDRELELIGTPANPGGRLKEILDDLNGDFLKFADNLSRKIYTKGKIDLTKWNRISNQIMNINIMTPVHNYIKATVKISKEFQKRGFMQSSRAWRKSLETIYPTISNKLTDRQYWSTVKQLDFESEVTFHFKKGREIRESLLVETILEMRSWNKCYDIEGLMFSEIEVTEARPKRFVKLNIGTGKLSKDFQMFLTRQLQVGLAPANFIRTFATDHVKLMQRTLLSEIKAGHDLGAARTKFVKKLVTKMTTGDEVKKLAFNTMRIMRTSHNRASASAVSLYGLMNRDIVKGLIRRADGRPCIACHPTGHKISTVYNGQVDIKNVKQNDSVFNGLMKPDKVAIKHKHKYDGELIVLELENGIKLTPTPYHKYPVIRNGKKIKIKASEIKLTDELIGGI